MASTPNNIPLGVTLSNPGNIRNTGITWSGQDKSYPGPYCKFIAPSWGFRAMARILSSYEKEGIQTIRGAITRWAPASENPTDSYIANVSTWSGIDPDTVTALPALPILKAITRQEQGSCPWPDSTILLGLALNNPQAEE